MASFASYALQPMEGLGRASLCQSCPHAAPTTGPNQKENTPSSLSNLPGSMGWCRGEVPQLCGNCKSSWSLCFLLTALSAASPPTLLEEESQSWETTQKSHCLHEGTAAPRAGHLSQTMPSLPLRKKSLTSLQASILSWELHSQAEL